VTVSNGADIANWTIESATTSMNYSNFTMSSASDSASMTITGDTGYTQAGEQCEIKMSVQDRDTTLLLAQNFAIYNLDANIGTYGFTSTVSSYTIGGVIIPYFAGKNTQVVQAVRCWHGTTIDVDQQGLYPWLFSQWNPLLIATPSAFTSPTDFQATCTSDNIIGQTFCAFRQWLFTTFTTIFVPNQQMATADFITLKNSLQTHSPFAEFIAVSAINTAPAASASGITGISIIVPSTTYLQGHTISASASGDVATLASPIRTITKNLLWFSLIPFFLGIAFHFIK